MLDRLELTPARIDAMIEADFSSAGAKAADTAESPLPEMSTVSFQQYVRDRLAQKLAARGVTQVHDVIADVSAALLAVAVPSMAYTGTLMSENAFYPAFLLAAWALLRALDEPTLEPFDRAVEGAGFRERADMKLVDDVLAER